jgi:hypothetical protein
VVVADLELGEYLGGCVPVREKVAFQRPLCESRRRKAQAEGRKAGAEWARGRWEEMREEWPCRPSRDSQQSFGFHCA